MENKYIWTIIGGVIVVLLIVIWMIPVQQQAGKLSADTVDTIPAMTYSDCISQIQETNPEMSDSDARDNCIAIDAVTKDDSSLCEEIVNPETKALCLEQF